MTTHRKLAAILCADAAGYSRLMAQNEDATVDALNAAREIFRRHIQSHSGRLIDTAGDSVLAEFPSVVEALRCAFEVQETLRGQSESTPDDQRMQFRIGINLGDVIEQADGTIYGDGVNVAARLQALAEPGGICISGTAYDQVEGKLPVQFKFIGEQQVKNIGKPVRAYRVVSNAPPTTSRLGGTTSRRAFAIGAAVVMVLLVLGLAWKTHKPPLDRIPATSSQKPRLAVLPLDNFSGHSEHEYFAEGMTEELISRLSRVAGLDVIARTSVMQYKGKTKSIADIGRELNVNTILEGSVRKAGNKVRITVQLIDVPSQGHLWSQDYDRELKDIFATQSDISEKVVEALHVRLVTAGSGTNYGAADPTTYALYLKGRYYAGKLTPDGLKKSAEYFEQAIAIAPNDANVWSAVARSYAMIGWFRYAPPNEAFSKGKAAAERALSLDASLSEAQLALGMVRFLFDWDWSGAEQAFQRAMELNPSNADAHLYYGVLHKVLGRNARAVAEIRRANELDPLNLMASAETGWVAFFGRRLGEAEQSCRRTLELDPNYLFALHCLQHALLVQKKPEAIAVANKFLELTHDDPYVLGLLGWTYGVLGNREEAQKILKQLDDLAKTTTVPPPAMFYANMGLGNLDATFYYLDKSYRERWNDGVCIKMRLQD
jgi:adenylate cyclase